MLCYPQPIDRQSIKNPAPLEESGVCGRPRPAANLENFEVEKEKGLTANCKASGKMAPPIACPPAGGDEIRNWLCTENVKTIYDLLNSLVIKCR
jgi:hypothetical protein